MLPDRRVEPSFVEPTKFDAEILCDGQLHRYEGLTDVIIGGTAVYAGAWIMDRASEPDDGKFELVPMQGAAIGCPRLRARTMNPGGWWRVRS